MHMVQKTLIQRARHGRILLLLLAVSACGATTVDLGAGSSSSPNPSYANSAPPNRSNSTDPPWQAVSQLAYVESLGVGDGQLFFSYATVRADTGSCYMADRYASCEYGNCAGTVRTWERKPGYSIGPGGSGQVSMRVEVDNGIAYFLGQGASGIRFCPTHDCRAPQQALLGAYFYDFALRDRNLHGYGLGAVTRCSTSNCDSTVLGSPLRASLGVAPAGEGRSIQADGEFIYLAETNRILRVRSDGSSPFEVVANGEAIWDIVVQGEFVYWTEFVKSGSVRRCPKAGCSGAPSVVVDGLSYPTELVADDTHLYFVEPIRQFDSENPGADRLSRCNLPGCDDRTVLVENAGLEAVLNPECGAYRPHLAMDESHLVFQTCDPVEARSMGNTFPRFDHRSVSRCGIAVIPK